jgi:hypothetical protein
MVDVKFILIEKMPLEEALYFHPNNLLTPNLLRFPQKKETENLYY